jgi:rfaE bifunctional protein nucleotidyltransferase chain/domain
MNEKVLSLKAVSERCRALQRQGRKVVLTNGCFDLLHVGHVRYLNRARELGDALVVALNSDDSVRALKGPGRPIVPEAQRAAVLASLACVDYVSVFSESMASQVVERVRPDIYVKGGDYVACQDSIPEAQIVTGYGGWAVCVDFEAGGSTTDIIETILRREREGLLSAEAEAPTAGERGC